MKTQQTNTEITEPASVDALAIVDETDADEKLDFETWVGTRERIRAEAGPYYKGLSLNDLAAETERMYGAYLAKNGCDYFTERGIRLDVARDEIRERSEVVTTDLMTIVRAALASGDVAAFECASEIYRSFPVALQRWVFVHHLYQEEGDEYIALRDVYVEELFNVAIQHELAEQEQEARS